MEIEHIIGLRHGAGTWKKTRTYVNNKRAENERQSHDQSAKKSNEDTNGTRQVPWPFERVAHNIAKPHCVSLTTQRRKWIPQIFYSGTLIKPARRVQKHGEKATLLRVL